jgi:hypothetical protein
MKEKHRNVIVTQTYINCDITVHHIVRVITHTDFVIQSNVTICLSLHKHIFIPLINFKIFSFCLIHLEICIAVSSDNSSLCHRLEVEM